MRKWIPTTKHSRTMGVGTDHTRHTQNEDEWTGEPRPGRVPLTGHGRPRQTTDQSTDHIVYRHQTFNMGLTKRNGNHVSPVDNRVTKREEKELREERGKEGGEEGSGRTGKGTTPEGKIGRGRKKEKKEERGKRTEKEREIKDRKGEVGGEDRGKGEG